MIDNESLIGLGENEFADLRRRKVGFVFQAFHILLYITLKQNVALPLAIGNTISSEAGRLSSAKLEHVGPGSRAFTLTPLFQDQELVVRASGLPVYRGGAVSTPGGSGYLELTDYGDVFKM